MKTSAYLLLFSCLLLFQGCFEIIEQVTVKKDGSGSFQLVLNLSKSKTRLNSIIKMKTINGHDVPSKEEVRNKITEIQIAVAKTPGLTNVKTSIDFDNYITSISYDFTKVTQLNDAVKKVYASQNGKAKIPDRFYEFDATSNQFSRLNLYSFKEDYKKLSNADKEVFATANYSAIFKFEGNVSAASNKDTKISPSKKATMLKLNALDVITQKKTIENKIKLTN